jgi:tRNA threonylcarbamoyladenosine biosynthesis protein TsaE
VSHELELRVGSKLHTVRLGELLGQAVGPGDVVVLSGPLGSGKTVFVQGMAQGLGADSSQVHSPTFTLLHTYPGRLPLYHFDLYRLDSSDELLRLGFDEYLFDGEGVSAVEWGDKFADMMPEQALWVSFSTVPEEPSQRCIRLSAEGPEARRVLERVKHRAPKEEGGSA